MENNISVVKDWSDIVEGWFYGQYETGPWWASHSKVDHDNNDDVLVMTIILMILMGFR